jgi:ribosomal protein L12E/L44/L45/RPP1/RPP2
MARFGGELLTIEPLLFTAFLQRFALAIGLTYAILLWRWWSLPIVLFGLTAEILAYTNLILTEGLTLPLVLILTCLTAHLFRLKANGQFDSSTRTGLTLVVAIALVALGLLAIRFPFAVFGICPLLVAVASHNTNLRRVAWAGFAGYLVAAVAIIGLLAFENSREFDQLSPNTRGARSAYWATWTAVFRLEPENASDPDLAEFYDDGDLYVFIGEVDSMNVPYRQQAAIYEDAIEDLLSAAGLGVWQSRAESLAGALSGGRMDDLKGMIAGVAKSDRDSVGAAVLNNAFSREHGAATFADQLNGGELPEAVLIAPRPPRFPLPAAQEFAGVLVPMSLTVLLVGLMNGTTRLWAAGSLAAVVAFAGFVGYIRADNFRFLNTVYVFGIATACAVVAMHMSSRSQTTSDHHAGP